MKILVTGGAGYIGSHVVRALQQTEHTIIVLDNLSKGHPQAVQNVQLVQMDIGDEERLNQLFATEKFDGVIHLAASSLVGESMENPAMYYENNVRFGCILLEAMRRHGAKYIVFSSTAAVYGSPIEIPIREDHPTHPTNTYGRTKLHFEEMLTDFSRAYDLRFISLRYFNAAGADPSGEIGEDHNPETHLIPIVLKQAQGATTPLAVFGTDYPTPDGTCIRDYIHVTDLASAHVLALDALAGGAKSAFYNLGNSTGYSVREVIEAVSRVVGQTIEYVEKPRRAGDPAVLIASSEKIREELGWQPAYPDLETIIAHAWKWQESHPDGYGDIIEEGRET